VNQILLILHLFGFGAGVAASIGNIVVTRLVAVSAGDAPVLNRIRPVMARVGHVGLALLWLTGAALIWSKWGGPSAVPALFWWKLALVVVLTGLIGYIDLTMRAVRQGNLTAAVRLPMLGMAGTVLLVLIVTIAVFAFN
jgi:uncharacterized membrane protein